MIEAINNAMEASRELELRVRSLPLPRHIGIIMDGNGRWAEARGRPRIEGHREGSASVREVTRAARRLGLEALTLYAFSSQNWARPLDEVGGLMALLQEYLASERTEILTNDIRLDAVGELDRLPGFVREPLEELRQASASNRKMVLTLALSYGARESIVAAAKQIAHEAASGTLSPDAVTDEVLAARLWTAHLPPVDLVIRTSGEKRLSNFFLWEAAYAELVFAEALWPDFRARELFECIAAYQGRERRYGLTTTQLRSRPFPYR